jgi:hypothetical protein
MAGLQTFMLAASSIIGCVVMGLKVVIGQIAISQDWVAGEAGESALCSLIYI